MKTIGIIGGMGPLATAELFYRIVKNTKSAGDGNHIHILIDNNPKVPDRTKALLYGGESPVDEIVSMGKKLENDGADILLMPCNTSFCFIDKIQAELSRPILNMIEETVSLIEKAKCGKVGLLATDGTIKTGIYQNLLKKHNIECIVPDAEGQKKVMSYIYDGVKAGNSEKYYNGISETACMLLNSGADVIILGCTELSIELFYKDYNHFVDPMQVSALTAIKSAGYETVVQTGIYSEI